MGKMRLNKYYEWKYFFENLCAPYIVFVAVIQHMKKKMIDFIFNN